MPNLSELFLYNGEIRLEFIVWPIFLGVCIGAFVTVFVRVKLGEVVRALIAKGAVSPETAVTLEELGLSKRFFIRTALRGKSALRRVVSATVSAADATENIDENASVSEGAESEGGGGSEKNGDTVLDINAAVDLDKSRFFIADENRGRAESLYDNTNSTLLTAVVTVLVAFVVAALSMVIVPNLQEMFENMVENFKTK